MSDHRWLVVPGGKKVVAADGLGTVSVATNGHWFCERCWAKVPRPYLQGGTPPAIMGRCFDRQPGQHRWKASWPGNFCLDCGLDDPYEADEALVDCGCEKGCDICAFTGCVINPNLEVPSCPFTPGSAPTAGK